MHGLPTNNLPVPAQWKVSLLQPLLPGASLQLVFLHINPQNVTKDFVNSEKMVLPSLLASRECLECNEATVVSCRPNWLEEKGHYNHQKEMREASHWDAFYGVTHLFSPCLWDHEHCKEYFRLKQLKQNPGWCFSKWLAMELMANLL